MSGTREEALALVRRSIGRLDALAFMLEHPECAGEALLDASATAARVHEALSEEAARLTNMRLVDAIALGAATELSSEHLAAFGLSWKFEPGAFLAAVRAWRAPARKGKGSGRTPDKWKPVAAALRSAGVYPPAPTSLGKQWLAWKASRGRSTR